MDPNAKLNLKQRVQRRIRRRRPANPFVYLAIAVVLVGLLVVLKFVKLEKDAPVYNGIAGTGEFTATFTGNINSVGDGLTADADDYAAYFEGVRDILERSDYVSVPINDPILDDYVETYTSGMAIKFAEKYFNSEFGMALKNVGVTDATLAHKNILRYGSKGAIETAFTLEMKDISISGLDPSSEADAAVTTEYYTPSGKKIIHMGIEASDDRQRDYANYDIRTYNDKNNNIVRDVTVLREQNPDAYIAVTVSWAENYLLKPSSYMKNLCRSLIDCGADAVIGTGIQMVLSVEKYGDGFIFYGIGNLVANEAYTMTQRGAILNCVFDESGNVTYELVPLSVKGGLPKVSSSKVILRTLVSDIGRGVDYRIENGMLYIS